MQTISFLNEQGQLSSEYTDQIDTALLLKGYHAMVTTKLVDERMIILQRQGLISFALSSRGEEACAVASAAALQPVDWMYPQYRELGIMFWRGYSIQEYLHHMFGNSKDSILGRQMPNHFGSRDLNVVTVSSPIGTQLPHAAGCGYAMKLQKEEAVAICYFGEGAASEGDFHVAVNFAVVRKTPTIFFCRNNGYAISTPASSQYGGEGIANKGQAYGAISYRVDGNDFFAIYDVVGKARRHCLEGKGPVLIEAMTYRLGAHSTSDDPSRYRSAEEVSSWEKKCPIIRLKRYLIAQKLWDEKKEKELIEEISSAINEAIETAKKTAPPSAETIIKDVYFSVPRSLQKQFNSLIAKEEQKNSETTLSQIARN